MHLFALILGALCCAGGAAAHFYGNSRHREDLLGFVGFLFLLTGLFLSRA